MIIEVLSKIEIENSLKKTKSKRHQWTSWGKNQNEISKKKKARSNKKTSVNNNLRGKSKWNFKKSRSKESCVYHAGMIIEEEKLNSKIERSGGPKS